MGQSDFYKRGEWNFFCDLCGRKRKSSAGVKTWNNLWVCREHKEQRNPQDFVRGVKDDQSVPWSRPEAAPTFVSLHWDRSLETVLSVTELPSLLVQLVLPSGVYPAFGGGTLGSSPLNSSAVNSGSDSGWAGPTAAEAVSVSEQLFITLARTITDSTSIAEAPADSSGYAVADNVIVTEASERVLTVTLNDTALVSEAAAQGFLFVVQELLTTFESASATGSFTLPLSDSVTAADLLSASLTTTLQDTATLSETSGYTSSAFAALNGRTLNGASFNA